jgi:hypothetical protein
MIHRQRKLSVSLSFSCAASTGFWFLRRRFSCITLLMLLFGQRLAKDYDGARTIVIYFIPAILAVYWLN